MSSLELVVGVGVMILACTGLHATIVRMHDEGEIDDEVLRRLQDTTDQEEVQAARRGLQ